MHVPRVVNFGLATAAVLLPTLGTAVMADRVVDQRRSAGASTPIQHVVVIFQENVSFDHYFGTYPIATNPANEPRIVAAENTPTVNGLDDALLHNNPNAANPKRLDCSQPITCDMDHGYTDEQKTFNHGLMDKFVEFRSGRSQLLVLATRANLPEHVDGQNREKR